MGSITFDRPPLAEVSFGLHFAPLHNFRTSHFGAFWAKLKPDFTETADKPIVAEAPTNLTIAGEWFPLPRVWFVHKDKEQLLQLQTDRFYFNWRKGSEGSLYPRFDSLHPAFHAYLAKLSAFLQEESLGGLDIVGCELVYTNHIYQGEGWSDLTGAGAVFPNIFCPQFPKRLGTPRGIAWQGRFAVAEIRLRADIKHASTNTEPKRELFVFELRAESRRKFTTIETVSEAFVAANDVIVNAFVDLTSSELQKEQWKRVRSS